MGISLEQFADFARGSGALTALALVCLVQYVCHVLRAQALEAEGERFRGEARDLAGEVGQLRTERDLTTLENDLLREFVAQTDLERSVRVLLERFVPHPSSDFAVLLIRRDGRWVVYGQRGIRDATAKRLVVPVELEQRVARESVVVLEGMELAECELLRPLPTRVRGRVRELYALHVGLSDETLGLFVTTTLYPVEAPLPQRIALARRLMQSLAGNVRWARTLESREDELRLSTEMLSLRGITDEEYPTPLAMIEQFVEGVRRTVGSERASLFLATIDGRGRSRAIVRCGRRLGPGLDARLREHEAALAEFGLLGPDDVIDVDAEARRSIGVDSLVGEAIVGPVHRGDDVMGVLVLTSDQPAFDWSRRSLIDWARGHLGNTLDRVLVQASTARRAKQDALTELANRGEFDSRLVSEATWSAASGRPVSLLLIDLDHFKRVNDTHGHPAGDEVLRATSQTLRDSVSRIRAGERALVARYGGEEIAVLLPGMGAEGAARIAEDLRANIERQLIPVDGEVLRVTASLGVATIPACGTGEGVLLEAADAALYEAKRNGRNRVVAATSPLSESASVQPLGSTVEL